MIQTERWKINLYTLWVSQVISLTSFGFGLPFIPFFIQELGVTNPHDLTLYTGILSAAPAITMAFMSPIWGMLSDKFGQKLMIQRATFAAVFIIGGMGMAQSVNMLIALRLLQGIFTGTITASSAFIAVNTPNHKLSYALGFLSSSTFIGYSLGPLLGGTVAETFGYRASFYVGAALMLVSFFMVTFIVKPVEKKEPLATKVHTEKSRFKEVFTIGIIALLLMLFLQRITRSLFSPFIPLYIQEITGTTVGAASKTGYLNGIIGFVSAISAIVISRLGDRYEKLKIMRLLLIVGFFVLLLANIVDNFLLFTVFYALFFLVIGGVEPLITSTTSELTPPEKRGTLFGVQGLVGSLGMMTSPAVGTFVSIHFGIKNILWVMSIAIVLNLIVTYIVTTKKMHQMPAVEEHMG